MDSHLDCRLVLCSCPTQAVAETLAHHVVESRLAACVNICAESHFDFPWGRQNRNSEGSIIDFENKPMRLIPDWKRFYLKTIPMTALRS